MIPLEISLIDGEEVNKLPSKKKMEYMTRVKMFAVEGLRAAEALLPAGHTDLRVVVDSEWELAITCDRCGLWAAMTQKVPYNRMSEAFVGGALLEVVECTTTERHKRFGKYSGDDAWAGYTSWNFDEQIISQRAGELFYKRPDPKRKKQLGWRGKRKQFVGGSDEATTKEQGG